MGVIMRTYNSKTNNTNSDYNKNSNTNKEKNKNSKNINITTNVWDNKTTPTATNLL